MANEWITQAVQSGVAVAVLVWIVQMGNKQLEKLYTDHNTRTDTLIRHLLEDNRRLGDTLISCVSTLNSKEPCGDK